MGDTRLFGDRRACGNALRAWEVARLTQFEPARASRNRGVDWSMSRRGAAVKRFVITLFASIIALAALGAIFAILTGRGAWHSITWTLVIGGAVLIVLNVAGSGSGRLSADDRTGTVFGGVVSDASAPGGFALGLALIGLGVAGLFA
jgi:hypothetical protein